MYVCDYDYADKNNTNNEDLNHHYYTRLISTRWKHQPENTLRMKINHLTLNKSARAKERHGEHASNQSCQTPRGKENIAEGRSTNHAEYS